MATVLDVVNKYTKNIDVINHIFGEGNWNLRGFLEQLCVYSVFFNIPFDTKNMCNDTNITILFQDNPIFNNFCEKHPKLDKTKEFTIHVNNHTIIIKALMLPLNIVKKSEIISLNKLNVYKINFLIGDAINRIKKSINTEDAKELDIYTYLYVVSRDISKKLYYILNNKEAIKKTHMDAIKNIEENDDIIKTIFVEVVKKLSLSITSEPIQIDDDDRTSAASAISGASAESAVLQLSISISDASTALVALANDGPPAKKTREE